MTRFYTLLSSLLVLTLLTGCNLTDEDKKRIDSAEDNLQKVALDPKILEPSNDEVIAGLVEVIVDIDDSVEYEKVTLQIGTDIVGTLTQAPYSFMIDTYFLAGNEKVTLLAKAYMKDGNQLRSEVVSVVVDPNVGSSLQIISPAIDAAFAKSSEVSIQWSPITSASAYEYVLNDDLPVEVTTTEIKLNFDDIAKHSVKVRAKNKHGDVGVWSDAVTFGTGLFAYAFDIKKYGGWSSYHRNDDPIDFLITEDDFVILARGSDQYSDGSGDSSNANIAKISTEGELTWHKTYSNYL